MCKLSDWQEGNKKPALVGVYQRYYEYNNGNLHHYNYWNGTDWLMGTWTVKEASYKTVPSPYQDFKWRGVIDE